MTAERIHSNARKATGCEGGIFSDNLVQYLNLLLVQKRIQQPPRWIGDPACKTCCSRPSSVGRSSWLDWMLGSAEGEIRDTSGTMNCAELLSKPKYVSQAVFEKKAGQSALQL
jgi:hypothetical protein